MAKNFNSAYDDYIKFAKDSTNVGFLQGTQEALNNLITNGGAQEGSFYLTSDSHRLYIGRKTSSAENAKIIPVPVNEGITTVATVEDLTNKSASDVNIGEFYYCREGNILAVVAGVDGRGFAKFIQLNQLSSLSAANTEIGENSSVVTVATTVTDSNNTEVTSSFGLIAGDNISLSVNNETENFPKIIISSKDDNTTYTIEANQQAGQTKEVSIGLKSDKEDSADSNSLKLISDDITFDVTEKGVVKLSQTNQGVDEVAFQNRESGGYVLTVGSADNSSDSDVFDPIIKLHEDSNDLHFNENQIVLDVYSTEETQELINSEITKKIQVADALTFKGVVNSKDDIPELTSLSNGDTFKVGSEISKFFLDPNSTQEGADINLNIGDLIIAVGEEIDNDSNSSKNGLLKSNAKWELIPSGNDEQILVVPSNETHFQLVIKGEINGNDYTKGGLRLNAPNDSGIVLSASPDIIEGENGEDNIKGVNIQHQPGSDDGKNKNFEQGFASTKNESDKSTTYTLNNFLIQTDAFGHISSLKQEDVTIKDTHNRIDDNSYVASVDENNVAKILQTLVDSDGHEEYGSFSITSDNLSLAVTNISEKVDDDGHKIASASTLVKMNLTWGTF